ncbi:MAG TPA: hypothetical protein VE172_08490 [Stackebrandtia sp.]|nr:hypothetical protein [Stackebrandtia sp.]HZE38838.1 hypothetical protein [Stackebrandtia sp.]
MSSLRNTAATLPLGSTSTVAGMVLGGTEVNFRDRRPEGSKTEG